GNKQPIDMGLPSMTSDEGTAKTTLHPKGSLGGKDLGGNKPPADIEAINSTIADPSGTDAKYQVVQTKSTRLRYQSLTENEGKPSHKGELDIQPLVLSTYADVRAFLLSDDEAQESEEDILRADKPQSSHAPSTEASDINSSCDDIINKYNNTLPLTEGQLVKYLRKVSTVLFDKIIKDNWEKHKEAAVNYANLKASIDEYYDENITHSDQTNKLVEASMSSLDKSRTTISDLYKGLNIITKILKEINNAVKDNPVINKKINKATESFTKISTNIAEVLSLVKGFNFADL
ncbi:hypothetical protein Tco_0106262, partial [Tanacetum coccineum]